MILSRFSGLSSEKSVLSPVGCNGGNGEGQDEGKEKVEPVKNIIKNFQ